jgi:hypothetical protein
MGRSGNREKEGTIKKDQWSIEIDLKSAKQMIN